MKNKNKKNDLPPIQDKYYNINKLEETENTLHEKDIYIKKLMQKMDNYDTQLKDKEQDFVLKFFITYLD
jgi:hypothetical protein